MKEAASIDMARMTVYVKMVDFGVFKSSELGQFLTTRLKVIVTSSKRLLTTIQISSD